MKAAVAKVELETVAADVDPANDVNTLVAGQGQRFVQLLALGVFSGGMAFLQELRARRGDAIAIAPAPSATGGDVMTADEVAAFLGVDRKTVYDYAGRGVIPCQRLGKRVLFSRAAVVRWLEPCSRGSSEGSSP